MKSPLFKYVDKITPNENDTLLVCFHHGGGGASLYKSWPERLRALAGVVAVQLPGREDRLGEALYTEAEHVAHEVSQYLNTVNYKTIVLFGYCMGGLIAYELAHKMQKGKLKALMIAASAEPEYAIEHDLNRELTDKELSTAFAKIFEKRHQVPCEPEYLDMVLPILKADRRISMNYKLPEHQPLEVPVVLLGGEEDVGIPRAALNAWHKRTLAKFDVKMFPGDHMFIETAEAQILDAVEHTLGECS